MSIPQLITIDAAVETSALDAGDVAANAVLNFPVSFSVKRFGKGKIMSLQIIDPDHNTAANIAGSLWLFNATVSPAAADAAHSISDGDARLLIGVIPIAAGDCYLSALNTVASVRLAAPLPFDLGTGTAIYGIYVVTATPTFAGGTLRFVLGIDQ